MDESLLDTHLAQLHSKLASQEAEIQLLRENVRHLGRYARRPLPHVTAHSKWGLERYATVRWFIEQARANYRGY